MKNQKVKKAKQSARKAFLRNKRENESRTDKVLAAEGNSAIVMNIRNRAGGRARKVRRG